MTPHTRRVRFALAAIAMILAPATAVRGAGFDVVIDTTPLAGVAGSIAFDVVDGDGVIDNTATIGGFTSNGTLGPETDVGDVTGMLTPGPGVIGDATFLAEIGQAITFGTRIAFHIDVTTLGAFAPFPDELAIFLLDASQLPFATADPTGADALLVIDIDGPAPSLIVYPSVFATVTGPCGNHVVDPGEQCDDGNNLDGDCCSADCRYEAPASPCTADADLCTVEQCDGAGACAVVGPVLCPGDACNAGICNASTGACDLSPLPDGTPCVADTDACTDDACAAGTCTARLDETNGVGCLDHFKCYVARIKKGTLAPPVATLQLANRFEAVTGTLKGPSLLCNPASEAAAPVTDQTTHLACYPVKAAKGTPRLVPQPVGMTHEFGNETPTVTKAKTVCVPSEKDAVLSTLPIDHYECYSAKAAKGTPKFIARDVSITDQFETKTTTVVKPASVCVPVGVDGAVVRNGALGLRCYKIKDAKGQTKFAARDAGLANELGPATLTATRSSLLCVPSEVE